MKSICVFCGSAKGSENIYAETARNLGIILASQQIKLVYGGAGVGLMGILADSVLEKGGLVSGVIPSFFSREEIAHKSLSELIFVDSMHERKLLMAKLSDGFIALPGGFGTMDELFEVLTWSQLDLHQKPIGILNSGGYFDHLIRFFDHMEKEKFVKTPHRRMILTADDPLELISQMKHYKPLRLEKWLNRIKA
jgi:uncharacterized protein (TIGR00730 family)